MCSPAAVAAAREAGFEPEDGELFLSRKVPASGRSRSMLSGRSVPRSVLASVAAELVTIHGQADQLRIATTSRQREFLDRYAGDEVALAAYGKSWSALRAMDERLERLNSQESSMRQQADYLRESIERINRVDPQPGEMDELRARRDRIENAAEIAEGVTRALGALDASQVVDDVESSSAADLIDHASQALRAIHVEGVFSELADRLDSISTDLSDVVFSLSGEVDNEASMEDLDAINGRIHELDELTRRWGPELSDVIAWRDKAVYDLEDLDASPEKVEQLEAKRAQLLNAAKKAAQAVSKRRRTAAKELASKVTAELDSLAMGTSKLEIRVAEREQLDATGADDIEFLFTPFPGSPQLPMGKSASGGELSRLMLALELVAAEKHVVAGGTVPPMTFIFDEVDAGVGGKAAVFTNIADLALNGSSVEVNNNFVTDLVINSFFRRNVNNFILLLFIQFPDMGQPLNPEDGLSAVGQVHILQADGFEHKVDVVYTEVPAIQLDDAADRQIIFLPQMFCLMVGAIFTLSGQIDAVALGPQFLRFCYPLSTQKASHFDFSQRVFL